ncbi:NADH dehydrogenase [ubiquinone] 1 alpha subcomplex assembly factor 2 [Prorops nasuta]|uniref:NADH dehydrogenase [ubiquinone] 1 alpha subcomplex assembly factor 2 n=1 Tax=Prorops nasuta TaxID=863751 RepID=UPI0034CDBAD4
MAKRIATQIYASLKNFCLKRTLVGEDYYGTKYYEEQHKPNSTFKKPHRYFEPANKGEFDVEIPALWESWLRYRRQIPPTKEQVDDDYIRQMEVKQKAMELEAEYLNKSNLPAKNPSQHEELKKFPLYDEFKK